MKFVVDVNIPQTIITALKKQKHQVIDIKEINLSAKDTEIVQMTREEDGIILTRDKDFISLTQFPKYQVATIVIRLKDQMPQNMLNHLSELLENQKEEVLMRSLTIIKEEAANSYQYGD